MSAPAATLPRRPPGRALKELIITEAKCAWRAPVGLALGVLVPVILLVILGSAGAMRKTIPGSNPPVTYMTTYVPVLIGLVLVMIALVSLPIVLVNQREHAFLRRLSTTPVAPRWLLADMTVSLLPQDTDSTAIKATISVLPNLFTVVTVPERRIFARFTGAMRKEGALPLNRPGVLGDQAGVDGCRAGSACRGGAGDLGGERRGRCPNPDAGDSGQIGRAGGDMLTHPERMGGGLQGEGGQHVSAPVQARPDCQRPRAATMAPRSIPRRVRPDSRDFRRGSWRRSALPGGGGPG